MQYSNKKDGPVPHHFLHNVAEVSLTGIVQYRHLIPTPVDQASASAWLYKHTWILCQQNKTSTPMNYVACESKLLSFVRSSMHPCQENVVATGRAVVCYARAVQAFSAGIKWWHCLCGGYWDLSGNVCLEHTL